MNLADVALLIRKRMEGMQTEVFTKPPVSMEELTKRLGVWRGLGDALSIVQDARKDEENDE